MEAEWVVNTLRMKVTKYGRPEIINSDQSSQFTSDEYIGYVKSLETVRISMDGKSRAIDNVYIERFFRTIKYEKIYLERPETGGELYQICSQFIQYYNENYTVMIGTDDTALSTFWCYTAQGSNHYERALNFYNFSDSDAVARGTTLQWQYGEVPGVAHNQNLMYNTILAGDSIPLAERLLFETPYHPVPQIAPLANFTTDDTIVSLPNATVQFDNWSINSMYYLWDFGDSTTSTGNYPVHTYLYADTFTVSLVAISGTGCENKMVKNNYIIANNGTGITNEKDNIGQLQINPNPSEGQITIKTGNVAIESIVIYNYFGNKADEIIVNGNSSSYIYNSKNMNGMYFIKVKTKKNVYTGKIIFR